ncbi:MAG: tetratricopeptide repeat protein, partial [bacterium]
MLRRRNPPAIVHVLASGLTALLLAASAGCSTKQERPAIAWRTAPPAEPGAIARNDDQAGPHLESLPQPVAKRSPRPAGASGNSAELNRAASLSASANARAAAGDIAGAIAEQQQALAIRERTLGPDNADVASTLTSLGRLEALQGDYTTAE